MSRRRILILLAVVVAAATAAGFALMLTARRPLLEARAAMERGRRALVDARTAPAGTAFRQAEEAFADADDRLANPLTRFASVLPVIGRTPDAAAAGARAGLLSARAGATIAAAIQDLPGGVGALAPSDGRIPVEPFAQVAPSLRRSRALLAEASQVLDGATTGMVPDVIAEPLREFRREVDDALRTVSVADRLAGVLPTFLGADAPRTYFVGAQNPAELRGTGGLIGAYTTMTVQNGQLELGSFRPVEALGESDAVEAPNPDYAARYDRFGGAGFWLNINMTPDFPSAATAIERLYRAVTGEGLDGTIVADPEALAALLTVTEPVAVPGSDVTVDAGTLVPFLTNEAYSVFTDTTQRKRLLGDVAGGVLRRFLSGAGEPAAAGRALAEAIGDGHLLLHATDPRVQQALEAAGAAGRLLDPAGDYLAVVANNAGGNKVDFYLDRAVRHDVRLLADGSAHLTTEIRFHNGAPSKGEVPYVIGPYRGVSAAGENVMFLSVYAASGARLVGAEENGEPGTGGLESELGHPVVWTNLRIPSGGSARLRYRWILPRAWERDAASGEYRLTFQGQPTIRPTHLELRVTPPPGMRVLGHDGVGVERGAAVWRGLPGDLTTIEVDFSEPAAVRVVDDLLPGPLV